MTNDLVLFEFVGFDQVVHIAFAHLSVKQTPRKKIQQTVQEDLFRQFRTLINNAH
jgi:hypothetical protein